MTKLWDRPSRAAWHKEEEQTPRAVHGMAVPGECCADAFQLLRQA
jgi:hypothetical protein